MKLRAYIVEDNATIRENLVDTLAELADMEAVGFAESENEGTQWIQQNPDSWDIVIIDLFLRQGSGLGVLATAQKRKPHQKAVVLSNYATADVRKRCIELGANAIFDKSNEIDALVDYCAEISSTI